MLNHRIRIFSSLLIAFIIVNIYSNLTDIKNVLSNFKFPTLNLTKLFTLQIGSDDNNLANKQFNNPDGSVKFITATPGPIQPTRLFQPTTKFSLSPTKSGPTKIPTKIPTGIPKPTNAPKPTKIPPLPPITSDIRPGTTMGEIFQEVGKRACFPPALLRAIQEKETGAWWSFNSTSSKVKIYNTYGWWITGAGNPCTGFGYHTQTGIVPSDSVSAGTRCQNAIPSGDDQGIMGILQVSQFEQDATRKYTKTTLPNNIDRRVLFDNALIFAIATKNRIGSTPKSCTDWTDDEVQIAAEKHYGSCADNYCNDVLRYYKQYR